MVKLQQRLRSPAWHGGHCGTMPRWTAGQPRVEHHALADVEAPGLWPERHHLGDDFVPRNVRKGREGRHRIVDVARVEVAEHELRVRATDAREDRLRHDPVGPYDVCVVDLVEAERDAGEHRLELVLGGGPDLLLGGRCAEQECLHDPPCCEMARMPIMKLSMSAVLASMTAFKSGR